MTASAIHLKALEFDDPEDGPARIVASFPAPLLYDLAVIHGAIPPVVLTPGAAEHQRLLYSFVSGYVANRFFEDGLNEPAPRYAVFSGTNQLAYHPVGSKDSDAPQQKLAQALDAALSDMVSNTDKADVDQTAERAQLAAMLSQTVINQGWRQVTPIGRKAHYTEEL